MSFDFVGGGFTQREYQPNLEMVIDAKTDVVCPDV